ncbi:unnamed protein product [Colias eurytheme]|nr:unnamed protein product [Colias eurytheme]
MYEEVLSKIRIVREELQGLADLLEFRYDPLPEFTQSADTRLQNIGEKLEFLIDIFKRVNQSNEYAVVFVYIGIISRIIHTLFEFISLNLKEPSAIVNIMSILVVVSYTLLLIILIDPFQEIEIEMQTMKLQVGRIATTDYVTDSIPAPLEMLYDVLSAIDLSFSPLGVFTVNRSLLAKTLGVTVYYLTIVIQFNDN